MFSMCAIKCVAEKLCSATISLIIIAREEWKNNSYVWWYTPSQVSMFHFYCPVDGFEVRIELNAICYWLTICNAMIYDSFFLPFSPSYFYNYKYDVTKKTTNVGIDKNSFCHHGKRTFQSNINLKWMYSIFVIID